MTDQLEAVLGYARERGISWTEGPDDDSLRLHPDGGDLTITFGADRRITATKVSAPAGAVPADRPVLRDLDELVNRNVLAGEEYQRHFDRFCRDLGLTSYEVDYLHGVITLTGTRGTLAARASLVAVLEEPDTWRWAWSVDTELSGNVELRADVLRQLGEQAGIPELVAPALPVVPGLPERLLHAVRPLLGWGGCLPGRAYEDVTGFWLLEAPELVPPEPSVGRVGRLVSAARKRSELTNHREAVAGYVATRNVDTTEDPDGAWTVLHLSGGDLRITFDRDDEIVEVDAGPSTRAAHTSPIPAGERPGRLPGRFAITYVVDRRDAP